MKLVSKYPNLTLRTSGHLMMIPVYNIIQFLKQIFASSQKEKHPEVLAR